MDFNDALEAPTIEERNSKISLALEIDGHELLEECSDYGTECDALENLVITDNPDGTILVCGTLYGTEEIPSGCKDHPRVEKIVAPFRMTIYPESPADPRVEFDHISPTDDYDFDAYEESIRGRDYI